MIVMQRIPASKLTVWYMYVVISGWEGRVILAIGAKELLPRYSAFNLASVSCYKGKCGGTTIEIRSRKQKYRAVAHVTSSC